MLRGHSDKYMYMVNLVYVIRFNKLNVAVSTHNHLKCILMHKDEYYCQKNVFFQQRLLIIFQNLNSILTLGPKIFIILIKMSIYNKCMQFSLTHAKT